MATTTDCTSLAQFAGTNPPYGTGYFGIVKLHCDMASIASAKSIVINGSASDVLQVWDIPVGTQIIGCMISVTTAEGAAATVAVGDGTNTAGYLAATSINAVAKTGMIVTDAYAAATKVYAATDTIDLLFATAADIDAAVFDVYLYCFFNPAVM